MTIEDTTDCGPDSKREARVKGVQGVREVAGVQEEKPGGAVKHLSRRMIGRNAAKLGVQVKAAPLQSPGLALLLELLQLLELLVLLLI